MSAERKRDTDEAVQRVLDDITSRRGHLSPGEIRTGLASGLASVGVYLPQDTLRAWARAIAEGERIRAETDLR